MDDTTVVEITPEEVGVEVRAERFDSLTSGVFRVATLSRTAFTASAFTHKNATTHEAVNIHRAAGVSIRSLLENSLTITVKRADGTSTTIHLHSADGKALPVTFG